MTTHNQIGVLSQNLRSINTGFDKLKDYIANDEFDVICAQEIWTPKGTYLLDNYDAPIMQCRSKKNGGGIGMWVHKNLRWEHNHEANIFVEEVYESQVINIVIKKEKLAIVNFYRPPQGNVAEFTRHVKTQIDILNNQYIDNLLFVGDANIEYGKAGKNKNDVETLLLEAGMEQLVNQYTRQGDTLSTIDHVYAKVDKPISVNVKETLVSDHSGITILYNIQKNTVKIKQNLHTISYKKERLLKVSANLREHNWHNELNELSTNDATEKLELILKNSVDKHLKVDIKEKTKESWFPKDIRKLRTKTKQALSKWKQDTSSEEKKEKYKALKKTYESSIKRERAKVINIKLSEQDPKKLWRNIREVTHTSKQRGPTKINIANTAERDTPEVIAEYFKNIPSMTANNIPPTNEDALKYNMQVPSRFEFKPVTDYDIIKLLKNLAPKASYGHDGVSSRLIKELRVELALPLKIIINKIIKNSLFPSTWKTAKVIPLHKKGSKSDIGNYRPISLLPAMSKIAEKVVAGQMYQYFEENNLFPKRQYGFRKGRSTEQAILDVTIKIEDMKHKKKQYGVLLIDFSKAFDVINHKILYTKLRRFGFSKHSITLIQSYLTNRKMFVSVNDKKSELKDCDNIGCPQGSCLGPLLYLIYTAELENLMTNETGYMFADDTAVVLELEPGNEIHQLQSTVRKLWDHFTANRLKMNLTKTVILTSHTLPSSNIEINNTRIKIQPSNHSSTYLGVELNAKLSWSDQITKTEKKMKSGLYALVKVRKITSTQTKKLIYESLIKSHLLYGLTIWGHSATKGQLDRIHKLQKIAVRLISGKKSGTHTREEFKSLNILDVRDLIKISSLNQFLNTSNKNNPLKLNWKLIETTTRAGIKYLPTKKGNTTRQIAKVITENTDVLTGAFKNKTKIKHITNSMLEKYTETCVSTPGCYACSREHTKY